VVPVVLVVGLVAVVVGLAVRGHRTAAGVVVVVLALGACGGGGQPEDLPTGAALLAQGRDVYTNACATCHGDALGGTTAGPPLLAELYAPGQLSDEAMATAIVDGAPQQYWTFGPMPGVGGLSDVDIAAVIAFVRDEQRAAGLE
jgi:mono/diheme cytochrome c family protein